MPFFKRDGDTVLSGPSVTAPEFELREETHEAQTYPVDGWYWFTDLDAALASSVLSSSVTQVSRRQAKQALILSGRIDLVQPAIDAIPDPIQRALIQSEWDDSQFFERQRPSLIMLAEAIGLNSAQTDELFATAATL